MTPDERIEKLLNAFGQTVADLPKPVPGEYSYSDDQHISAWNETKRWAGRPLGTGFVIMEDYICHLADVIDRMEIALETARRWASCGACNHFYNSDNDRDGVCQCMRNYIDCDNNYLVDDLYLEGGHTSENSIDVGT